MLSTYLTSVIIYTLILWAETKVFTNPAKDNGWMDTEIAEKILSNKNCLFRAFILALIPVVRLFFAISFVIIGFCEKEILDNV